MKAIIDNQRLIVALDFPSTDDARRLVAQLDNSVNFYKVGLELFMAGGYFEFVDELAAAGKQVFVDLKFFDVPATVGRAVERLQHRNISFVTVHGNDGIMQAAAASKGDLKILAVTVLTSIDRGDLDDLGFQCDVEELVLSRARRAIHCGCDGVVASGHEAARLRDELGDRLMIVIPGIRPVENIDDQKRTVTVEDAFSHGADYIVVGRPIRDADNPRKVAETIQREIASALMSARPS
ncbi:MAG TPA: orotidine-5'-phosphate decarboxylase [Gammaproteobacteria bacterium]|nr:orotidine-5'-phosphate decarboxylase [Gammaproteobacteria bacterium]